MVIFGELVDINGMNHPHCCIRPCRGRVNKWGQSCASHRCHCESCGCESSVLEKFGVCASCKHGSHYKPIDVDREAQAESVPFVRVQEMHFSDKNDHEETLPSPPALLKLPFADSSDEEEREETFSDSGVHEDVTR